jgi:DHA1 family tetracycline resistance protein-like MFS transporter
MADESNGEKAPGIDYGRALPIFALVFVDVLGLTILLPLLHLYAIQFGASPLEIGLVAAAFPLAQLIGVPVMGALSDRYGRKPLLLISQVTTCIGFIMLGLADSLWLVALSRIVDGLFGANFATAQAALSDITDDDSRAQGLGLIGAAFGLGFLGGPVIAILALEFSDSLSLPAYIAAAYSALSIVLTALVFKETLPPEKRGTTRSGLSLGAIGSLLTRRNLGLLLLILFFQQIVFYAFENLLGLFTLSQIGVTGQGNALFFLFVGLILVVVQGRYIGKWTRRWGEAVVVRAALGMLAVGLLLFAFTPRQPHPLYVREIVENDLRAGNVTATESVIGDIQIQLPDNEARGLGGAVWMLVALVPIAIGSGLIRPGLNSLMTRSVPRTEFGAVLGTSAAFVSAANAAAPLIGGLLFQHFGAPAPFLVGGLVMLALFGLSLIVVQQPKKEALA